MRALSPRTLLAVLLLSAATGLLAGAGWLAWNHEPSFYRHALDTDRATLARGSNELLEEASSLLTDLGRQGEWRSLFTAEQINGWLAVDVPKNHASLFPAGFAEPRVALERGRILVACRRGSGFTSGVVAIEVEPYLLAPNELAIRIRGAWVGWVPLPLAPLLEQIASAATDAELPLRWDQAGGDPVAVLSIDARRDDRKLLSIESLEIQAGELYVAGTTRASNWPSSDPAPTQPPVLEARLPDDREPGPQ